MIKAHIGDILQTRFPGAVLGSELTKDGVPSFWIKKDHLHDVCAYLKNDVEKPYRMLFDLSAIDERLRSHKKEPFRDFTVFYHLFSFQRKEFVRLKLPLDGQAPSAPSVTSLWKNADWYEREVWDMFGIRFEGHPRLRRILLPQTWLGHPLRKEFPARATEMGPFRLSEDHIVQEEKGSIFHPEEWGFIPRKAGSEYMILNMGPQHPGTHGPFRIILEMDGEEIIEAVPDIGYHHRGAEKMAERQTWHTYIPYTDRVDYLGGVMNNLPYVLAVEKLAGIEVPDRTKVIRIMMSEFFRISSHLVFYGTFSQDVGQMSPVFYMFTDRELVFKVVESICGGRMHPSWFRIGGVAHDLPQGWDQVVREFVDYFPKRLDDYEKLVLKNPIFKARTLGVGAYTTEEAIEWGATGPSLRATGFSWDFRKEIPYSGFQNFDFDVPVGTNGDSYDRAVVHAEELRQSLRIIKQCLENMPEGEYKSRHPLTTPPVKARTMHDIETLIAHFLNVTWGPVIPAGEAMQAVEATKGCNAYYVTSDENIMSYRTRIRTPSFAHLQMIPLMAKGMAVADLITILGSIDFVMADVDR